MTYIADFVLISMYMYLLNFTPNVSTCVSLLICTTLFNCYRGCHECHLAERKTTMSHGRINKRIFRNIESTEFHIREKIMIKTGKYVRCIVFVKGFVY